MRKDINPLNMKEGITVYDIACLWKWSVLHQRWCHVWSSKTLSERIILSVHVHWLCVSAYHCQVFFRYINEKINGKEADCLKLRLTFPSAPINRIDLPTL